jgi:ribosomal protein S18 acetylase RimI-like enzyme
MTALHTAMTFSVEDYRPGLDLDHELASLVYAAVRGWPDQRPTNSALVRSMLRAPGMTASTLVLMRDQDQSLVAAAALRWPATIDAPGRLWGPIVHPDARGGGIGPALMRTVCDIIAAHPGVTFMTTEIPESRTAGWTLFERHGWRSAGLSTLLTRPLPGDEPPPSPLPVRAARKGEYLAAALAALFASCRPDVSQNMARDTFIRWSGDSRYTPDGLLLAEGPGHLMGAALVYPVRHWNTDEPPEALLADLIIWRSLDRATADDVRTALVAAALRAGAAAAASTARAVTDDPDLVATLLAAGFDPVDQIRHYTRP